MQVVVRAAARARFALSSATTPDRNRGRKKGKKRRLDIDLLFLIRLAQKRRLGESAESHSLSIYLCLFLVYFVFLNHFLYLPFHA